MKLRLLWGIILACGILANEAHAQTLEQMKQELDQMIRDNNELTKVWETYLNQVKPQLDHLMSGFGSYTQVEQAYAQLNKVVSTIEVLAAEDMPKIKKAVDAFYKKYGDTERFRVRYEELVLAVKKGTAETIKDDVARRKFIADYEYSNRTEADTYADQLKRAYEDFQANIPDWADQIAGQANTSVMLLEYKNNPAEINDEIRYIETFCKAALAVYPESLRAKSILEDMKTASAKKLKLIEEGRKNSRFPKQYAGFKGPGSADALAAEALKFIAEKDPYKHKYLKAVITENGVWEEYKSIFGITLHYRLPVTIAYEDKKDPNLVHVVFCEFQTSQPKPQPPFAKYYLRSGYDMYKENLNK